MTDFSPSAGVSEEMLLVKPGKWHLVVITSLRDGRYRFNALRAAIGGISQKVLTTTLRELERDGFVSRTQYPSIPPRVEYELTEIGLELLKLAEGWERFVRRNRDIIARARQDFDALQAGDPAGRAASR